MTSSSVTCENCGAAVTDDYARVFAPGEGDTVECCPRCPDRVRDGSTVREARSTRQMGRAVHE